MGREESRAFKRLQALKERRGLPGTLAVIASKVTGRSAYLLAGECIGTSAPEARKALREMKGAKHEAK